MQRYWSLALTQRSTITAEAIEKRVSSQPSWRFALVCVCLAATAVIAPMLFLGNVSGHDFRFHVESWMDVAGQWHEGIVFPRWAEWANWGFGEPRFIFYPPLSWLIGATIGSALPWNMAPGTFVWLTLVIAGMSMCRFAREWIPHPYANLAGVLYAINPYHLVIVYFRSAFGELLAAALLPLLIWAALRVIEGEWRRVPILSLVFAAIWLSNAPGAVIATYSLAVILVTGCTLCRRSQPMRAGAAAMAGGFALASFYILPATWEQRWIQIKQIVVDTYRPSANFLFTRANDRDFVAFNWKVSWVATGMILLAGIAALLTMKRRERIARPWWVLSILVLVSTGLMLPPSTSLWRVLPKLWFLQFPWRWLEVVGVAFAFFVALAIATLPNRAAQWVTATTILAAIGVAGAAMLSQAPWDSGDLAQIDAWIRDGRGYEGTDEYAPIGCDRYQLPGDPDDSERPADVSPDPAPRIAKVDSETGTIVPAAGVRLHVETWKSTQRVFTSETRQPLTLALRLVQYPAWDIQINGQAEHESMPETQQVVIPLSAGSSRVQIRFRHRWDRTIGDVISLLAAIILGGIASTYHWRALGTPS